MSNRLRLLVDKKPPVVDNKTLVVVKKLLLATSTGDFVSSGSRSVDQRTSPSSQGAAST
jgi:hypothetical protein